MAFTVPSEWQYLDGTHHVAPRAPIVGGKTGDYAFEALIADHHLVRANRMSCTLSMGNTDAWTNTAGPGGGVADWASFGKTKIETQDGFDGRLNVTVWCEDCESAGGVYVAVFNTSSVLQGSVTLTNTTGGTKQERTGSITGLSANTQYLIEVRFAADTVSSPTAKLYGVLVEPRELTSSTIDDKLNDQRANDDETASSLIPFRIREHLISSMRERMPHCTHSYPEESKLQMSVPEVSTHPDEWWGIPIRVPIPLGVDEVGVRIRYEVATADVKVRLRVIGGAIGSASTLSTTGSVTLSSEMTVPLRSVGGSRWAILMLSFQSQRGSSVAVANGATSSNPGMPSRKHTISLASGSVAQHNVIQNTGNPNATYIGNVTGGTSVTVWPERWPTSLFFSGSVYELGTIKLHSIGLELKADATALRSFSIPTTKSMSVGKVMQYETLTRLEAAAWEVYSSGAQWYAMRPTPAVLTSFFGVSSGSGAPASGAIFKRRADSEGIYVWLLVISGTVGARTVDTSVKIQNRSASVTETTVLNGTVGSGIFIGTVRGEQLATQIVGLSDGFATTDWGAQDLIRESEAAQLGVIEGIVSWPSGTSVGDTLEVTCSVGTNVEHVFGASLHEALPFIDI